MAAAVAETGIRGHGRSMAYFTLYSQWMGTCRRLLGFLGPYRRKLIARRCSTMGSITAPTSAG